MDGSRRRRIAAGAIVAGAALFALPLPSAAQAPEETQVAQAEEPPQVEAERLAAYAAIHVETAETAREFYAELARTYESQRKAAIRTEMDEALAAIREKHGMTNEEFKRITYVISVHQPTRDAFERLVAEGGGASPPE